MAMVVDEIFILVGVILGFGGWAGFILLFTDLRKWVPEWSIFKYCRKNGVPVISLVTPGSGESTWLAGTKDETGDPIFNTGNYFGIQVDPKFSGEIIPNRYSRGLVVYNFATTLPFAIDTRHALAIQTTITTVRKKFPKLGFLTNDQLVSLLCTDRDDLGQYCKDFIEAYGPEIGRNMDMKSDELTVLITEAQDLLANTAIMGGWTSFAYAFKNISTSYLAQDLHQLQMLVERKIRKQIGDKMSQYVFITIAAFGALLVMVGGAIAYTIISG